MHVKWVQLLHLYHAGDECLICFEEFDEHSAARAVRILVKKQSPRYFVSFAALYCKLRWSTLHT